MKKLFTLIAVALMGSGNLFAQSDVIELSWDTMIKDEAGTNAADQTNTTFEAEGWILTREDGSARTQAQTIREECGKVLNIQNNKVNVINIPSGSKVYKINMYGWSQGDNWTYLYAYGPSSEGWEWTDPIGSGIKDNSKIISEAKYPLDPCTTTQEVLIYHNAGYCFASIDFSDEPYEGKFAFVFNGNNQERVWFEIYTSKEAADKAPAAEAVTIGKDKSQQNFITAISAPTSFTDKTMDGTIYNMAGQRVDASYKGLVIKNGKKFIVK